MRKAVMRLEALTQAILENQSGAQVPLTATSARPFYVGQHVRSEKLEREMGFEPTTLALARRCSTTELFPLSSDEEQNSTGRAHECQGEAAEDLHT
jgi:hypothetical protein